MGASAAFTLKPVEKSWPTTPTSRSWRRLQEGRLAVDRLGHRVHRAHGAGRRRGRDEETSELFCLVTSLLDPEEYPALDLACCYPRRWGTAAAGIPPDTISFPHALAAATGTVAALSPEHQDLALATFLVKVLAAATFTRDRPDRASPRKTKKSGGFPARKPGEPSVTNVIRKIQFHLLSPWQIA